MSGPIATGWPDGRFDTEDEVHVWRFLLDRPPPDLARLATWLSDDEHLRAGRLRAGPVRDRFVVGRAMLRLILGHYLGASPDTLVFTYETRGKPALAPRFPDSRPPRLQFNLAHSRSLAALALSPARRVGIDVEAVRPMDDLERMASSCLSQRERRAFDSLPQNSRPAAFFRAWTRKEAFLKSTGEGLSTPLGHVEVPITPEEPPAILALAGRPGEEARWSLADLDLGPGYLASLVAEGPLGPIRLYHATPDLSRIQTP